MSLYPRVNMELGLLVSHHRDLLQGNASQAQRVAASVIQDLLGPEYDVMKITLAELFYYFFMAKASSLGPVWKFPWECQHVVITEGQETKCGHHNVAAYDLSKMTPKAMDPVFKPHAYQMKLTTVGKLNTGGEDRMISVHLDPPTLQQEFDIWDGYLNSGISPEKLFKEKLYDMTVKRVVSSLKSDDNLFTTAALDDKVALLQLNPMDLIANLMRDIKVYDGVGYEQEFTGYCEGCKRKVTLRLPFLAGIVVYEK